MIHRSLALSLVLCVSAAAPALAQNKTAKKTAQPKKTRKTPRKRVPEKKDPNRPLYPGLYLKLKTNLGTMIFKLHYRVARHTVANIVGLVEGTKAWKDKDGKMVKRPFYDGLTFHRLVPRFVLQGGCPIGDGTGNPGWFFKDETSRDLSHYKAGVLSMANSDGPRKRPYSNRGRTNGSQFFITLNRAKHLDGKHTVFGVIVRGHDVLKRIAQIPADATSRPRHKIVIQKASVIRKLNRVAELEKLDPDPKKIPAADQPLRELTRVNMVCIQYKGCAQQGPQVVRTKAEALAAAKRAVAHARQKNSKMHELATAWSDLKPMTYVLIRRDNDPSLEPLFRLKPGQVSDAIETPYGYMVGHAFELKPTRRRSRSPRRPRKRMPPRKPNKKTGQ